MKFKVGDTVIVKRGRSNVSQQLAGHICTINEVGAGHVYYKLDQETLCNGGVWPDELELIPDKEENVMFKKGDLLECVHASGFNDCLTLGRIYTALRDSSAREVLIADDIGDNTFHYLTSRFKLAKPKVDDLQTLVDAANAGYVALARLRQLGLQDKVTLTYTDGSTGPYPTRNRFVKTLSIKPEPKKTFEAFTTSNGREVRDLFDGRVKVGCKKFAVKPLTVALDCLLVHGHPTFSTAALDLCLTVTRNGIKHTEGVLSWNDADQLLAALKKLE